MKNHIQYTLIIMFCALCLCNSEVVTFQGKMNHTNKCQNTFSNNITQKFDLRSFTAKGEKVSALTADLAIGVFKRKQLIRAAIISCQISAKNMQTLQKMSREISTSIITPTTIWKLDNAYSRLGILFELELCPTARALLSQIQPYLNSSYHWLLVAGDNPKLDILTLRFDSSVTVALHDRSFFNLLDIYYDPSEGQKKSYQVGRYSTDPRPLLLDWVDAENAPHRSFVNRTIKTGFLIAPRYNWSYPLEMKRYDYPRGHPRVGTSYFAMKDINVHMAVAKLVNITSQYVVYNEGGAVNRFGIHAELLGGMQSHKVEISATKLLRYKERFGVIDYLNMCDPYRIGVIYYVSRSSDASVALLEPFSTGLWYSIGAAILLGVTALLYAGRSEIRSSNDFETDMSVCVALLILLGPFTGGQGHPTDVRWFSPRIIIGVYLFAGFIITAVYSALITTALFSDPSPNFGSRAEYMRSSLTLTTEDFFPFSLFFRFDMDNDRRELYEKKVKPPTGSGFRPVQEAFQGMLAQKWAMFGFVNSIKLEMAKATPQQVCRLSWIQELAENDKFCPAVKKRSELKNILSRGYPLVHERGIYNRELRKHHAGDVPCYPEFKLQWIPVEIKIIIPAVLFLLIGAVAAILVFVAERLTASVLRRNSATGTPNLKRDKNLHTVLSYLFT